MFIALILISFSLFMALRSIFKPNKNNPYITQHQKKMKDDYLYKKYLKWCEVNGQIPIDKVGFENIRKNEKALFESLHKEGIHPYIN